MRIEIKGSDFSLTQPIVAHTEKQLRRALARSSHAIRRVVVRLGDTNGPRGGADKYCRILVHLKGAGPIRSRDVGEDLYRVITESTRRARRHVSEQMHRRNSQARSGQGQRAFSGLQLPESAL